MENKDCIFNFAEIVNLVSFEVTFISDVTDCKNQDVNKPR